MYYVKKIINMLKLIVGDGMASRMEKYHSDVVKTNKRIERKKSLYENKDQLYTNIGGILETGDNNSVDIEKLKETIKKYEEENSSKKKLVKKDVEISIDIDRNYNQEERKDINELIDEAKKEHEDDEIDKYRTLKKEEYSVLMKIKGKNNRFNKKIVDSEIKEELMNTMQLSKKEIEELEEGIDIFGELESDKPSTSSKSIQEIINEAKQEEQESDFEDTLELDGSFNTASLKLTKNDFEELNNQKKSTINKTTLYILLVLILLIIVLCGIYFIV